MIYALILAGADFSITFHMATCISHSKLKEIDPEHRC